MSLIDQKKDIYGQIAALRVSTDGFPQFKLNSSFPSIDNSANSLDFLVDLLKSTVGFESLKSILSKVITFELPVIEQAIKTALKSELRSLVSCGVNPSIPDFFKHQNINPSATGVDLELRKVDYLGIMLVDPSESVGLLAYDDISGGLNSVDFHTYLFETIQLDGTQTDWGSQTLGSPNDVLSFQFNSNGVVNNVINVKASEYYSDPVNNKKMTDVNNDYIDSINLFGSTVMLNSLIDSIFGSISFKLNKTPEELKKEIEIETIIECIINTDDDDVIDDNFFSFSNETSQIQEELAYNRSKGYAVLKTDVDSPSTVTVETLTSSTQTILTASTLTQKASAINSAFDKISLDMSLNVNLKDKPSAKLSFIDNAIKKLMIKMGGTILSPKVFAIFSANHFIVYGTTIDNPIEWMKNNKTLMKSILDSIRNTIIKILLNEVLKSLRQLVQTHAQKVATDYAKSQSAQLASLVGIPQDILRIIQGLR